ncbi:MAG: hypothetical protein HYZ92_02775 [Candidatus Omnitrophica bacterium]|nr:hypothetical protein [Candidatus Omnitrophota bacterium]
MLIVFGIIAVILASSLPALSDYANKARLQGATRQVVGLVSLARAMAISAHAERTVLIDPQEHELVIEETLDEDEPRRVHLPSSVTVDVETSGSTEEAGSYRLIFQPTGSLSGRSATVWLSSDKRTQSITILAATGALLID